MGALEHLIDPSPVCSFGAAVCLATFAAEPLMAVLPRNIAVDLLAEDSDAEFLKRIDGGGHLPQAAFCGKGLRRHAIDREIPAHRLHPM